MMKGTTARSWKISRPTAARPVAVAVSPRAASSRSTIAVDDSDTEEDPHAGRITIDTTSTDPDFDRLATADVVARVADDDRPEFLVTDPADLAMDEADAAGTERAVNVRLA
ncbi:MAG: hypothetical protein KY410_10020, partial [Proteobacteria bacterium]|nr:hypothetical protein [Pseudomonadota bacterium]